MLEKASENTVAVALAARGDDTGEAIRAAHDLIRLASKGTTEVTEKVTIVAMPSDVKSPFGRTEREKINALFGLGDVLFVAALPANSRHGQHI